MVTRTFDLLDRYKTKFSKKQNALGGRNDDGWYVYSAYDFIEKSHLIALGLMQMGIIKGDKVASISKNCPEWNFFDLGIAMIGAVHVPIYPTISDEDYNYILNHCDAKLLVVSDNSLYKKMKIYLETIDSLKEIVSIDPIEGIKDWKKICTLAQDGKYTPADLEKVKNSIGEDDLATIIYTSGTTGQPKGVMLSHKNLVYNFKEHSKCHNLGAEAKVISFLPLCHVYERSMNYHFQYKGMGIYYVASLGAILPAVKEIKPDMFNTVPRLLERIYDGIMKKGQELDPFKRKIFNWAVKLSNNFTYQRRFRPGFALKRLIADRLVYAKWREAMGGNIKIIVSGGAALQTRIGRTFGIAKIRALEGYGLTETSPVIAVSNLAKRQIKVGTVGPPLPGTEIKFADDGEIICKGPGVMMGYYKSPELTAEVIDKDGFFHTGDVGILDEGRYLKITDRKKEIFKLSGGKYIAPQMIENKIKESIYIEQVMVIGENEKFASAIVVPDFQVLHDWCSRNKIKFRDNRDLINNKEVLSLIHKEISTVNQQLGQVEEIKRFRMVIDQWSPDTGELSPTLKLKRKVLHKRYADLIEDVYAPSRSADFTATAMNLQKPEGKKFTIRAPKIKVKWSINELFNRMKFN